MWYPVHQGPVCIFPSVCLRVSVWTVVYFYEYYLFLWKKVYIVTYNLTTCTASKRKVMSDFLNENSCYLVEIKFQTRIRRTVGIKLGVFLFLFGTCKEICLVNHSKYFWACYTAAVKYSGYVVHQFENHPIFLF